VRQNGLLKSSTTLRAAAAVAVGIVGATMIFHRSRSSTAAPSTSEAPPDSLSAALFSRARLLSGGKIPSGCVVLAGNPMLDTSLNVTTERLHKLGLRAGIEPRLLPTERRKEILDMVTSDPESVMAAGGSAVNTAKALQWALGGVSAKGACVCIGAIGDDKAGRVLESSCSRLGVTPLFQKISGVRTGHCAVLVPESGDRCIVAVRGAYRNLAPAFVTQHGHAGNAAVQRAQLLYATSFLVSTPSRYEAVDYMATRALETGKLFALNLSSAGMIEIPDIRKRIVTLLPRTDLLFSNESEATTLVSCLRKEKERANASKISAREAAEEIALLLKPGGTVAITRGREPTLIATNNYTPKSPVIITEHPVVNSEPVSKMGPVVDTNGAGDAFVGGYLAAIVKGHLPMSPVPVEAGHHTAGIAVRCHGSVWDGLREETCPRPKM